jgi:hypothetical protein
MKPINKPKPHLAKTVSWNEIENRYKELVSLGLEFDGMLSLVNHIRQSNLAERLYAYTSMHTLIVTIYDIAEWHREELHIEYNVYSKAWRFIYYSRPDQPAEKEEHYEGVQGIDIFLKYIELLKW